MRKRWIVLALLAVFLGALGGAMLAPQPAGAVNRDMVQLQQQVAQLLQGQQDLRSAIDTNSASLKTLVQQQLDSVSHLSTQMGALQTAIQQVQANSGARIDTMAQQTQGLSDNLQDVQARVGKLSQQLTDMQNLLQSIDAKVSGAAPAGGAVAPGSTGAGPGPTAFNPAGGGPTPSMAPISADTLYQNALRDYNTGKYDLAHQEFSDYIRNFPSNDLASNAEFYLGEISYAQGSYKDAISAYDNVLVNYPHSFKQSDSLLKKAMAEQELGQKTAAIRDLREVVRRFPGSDSSRRAQAKLHELGVPASTRAPR
ncbi:MAG TPA: tol-pal system protein YbgF [Candidatus Acidoferrum sp.]|nr:tol-pal system protein YbgF [Candidatus Acidoferrum sp.]